MANKNEVERAVEKYLAEDILYSGKPLKNLYKTLGHKPESGEWNLAGEYLIKISNALKNGTFKIVD